MKIQMYNVDNSNKYLLKVKQIENLEDAGDDFTTEEELREMLGLKARDHLYAHAITPNKNLIAKELAMWKANIPKGKKSVVCTDVLLIEALKECFEMGFMLNYFFDGLRRSDNKFTLKADKKERKTNKNDYSRLLNLMVWSINTDQKYTLDLKYTAYDRSGSLALLKKLITWEEINFTKAVTDEDKVHMRAIWDNPTMFDAADDEA